MGACYGKGGAPQDPDKQPYAEPSSKGKKGKRKKGKEVPEADDKVEAVEEEQTTPEENGANKVDTTTADDNENELVPPSSKEDTETGNTAEKDKEEKQVAQRKDVEVPTVSLVKGQPTEKTAVATVKADDVEVAVPKLVQTRSTAPSAWKPQPPLRSSGYSDRKSPVTKSSASPMDKPPVKVESPKRETSGSSIPITPRKSPEKETTDGGLESLTMPNLGEPIDAEAILRSIQNKSKVSGVTVSTESKTTTVTKQVDTTGQEVVDVKTKKTEYTGPITDMRPGNVIVKTTVRTFVSESPEKTTDESRSNLVSLDKETRLSPERQEDKAILGALKLMQDSRSSSSPPKETRTVATTEVPVRPISKSSSSPVKESSPEPPPLKLSKESPVSKPSPPSVKEASPPKIYKESPVSKPSPPSSEEAMPANLSKESPISKVSPPQVKTQPKQEQRTSLKTEVATVSSTVTTTASSVTPVPVVNGSATETELKTKKLDLFPTSEEPLEELVIKEDTDDIPAEKQDQEKQPSPVRSPSALPSFSRTSGLPSPTSKFSSSARSSVSPEKKSSIASPTRTISPVLKSDTEKEAPVHPMEPKVVVVTSPQTEEVPKEKEVSPSPSPRTSMSSNGDIESTPEPAPTVQLKKSYMNMLCDFSKERESLFENHSWCANSRNRLMGCIDKWANGEDKEKDNFKRVWAITGKPGMGKTALAAEVCRRHSHHLVGAHFFHCYNLSIDYNDARNLLQSFAYQMCASLRNYPTMLPTPEKLQQLIKTGDLGELFDILIGQPLSSLDADQTQLVVLDAVDECNLHTRQQLLQLINALSANTPEWLYILITIRDDNQLLAQLDNVRTVELKTSNDNLLDIKRYLKDPMSSHMDRISLDGGLTQLVKRTDGNFLCGRILGEMINNFPSDKQIALREVEGMFSKGLNNVHASVFKSFKEGLSGVLPPKEVESKYEALVGFMCCALEPVSTDFLDTLKLPATVLDPLKPVLDLKNGVMSFYHRETITWLIDQQQSGSYHIDIIHFRHRMSDWCLSWLDHICSNANSNNTSEHLQHYALKWVVWHLLDTPKQQESLASFLCELQYIKEKLKVPGVDQIHLLKDYKHSHYQTNTDSNRLITMSEYMKKHSRLLEQMKSYYQFVKLQGAELMLDPDFTIHVAANYPSCDRIQQNARVELDGKHWIEDLTSVPETHNISKSFGGQIEGLDLSPDGKTLAIVTKDEDYQLLLFFINMATCEKRMEPVDIKMLKDRVGLTIRFLPEGTAAFVGSLTTFISTRQGKTVPSGIDASTVQMKEKYSIECCDISKKYMVCGLSTFPWGGRSLHLAILDHKAKKCLKTLEVLKFRFGGSAQFGIKCCVISDDESMMATGVKQTNKNQLTCSIWCLSKWTTLHSVTVESDTYSRCLFVGSSSILVGTEIRSVFSSGDSKDRPREQTQVWNFKTGEDPHSWEDREQASICCAYKSGYAVARWFTPSSNVLLEVWSGKNVQAKPQRSYMIRGVDRALHMLTGGEQLIIITEDEMKIYHINDLEEIDHAQPDSHGVLDVLGRSFAFHPRSDETLIAHHLPGYPHMNIGSITPAVDDMTMTSTPFTNMTVAVTDSAETKGLKTCFNGPSRKTDFCHSSSDGNFLIFNNGSEIRIWNRSTNATEVLTNPDNIDNSTNVMCVSSAKDNLIGLFYPSKPTKLYTFDLKTRQLAKTFEFQSGVTIMDFTFMPSNGQVLYYHGEPTQSLVVCNQRTGAKVSQQDLNISFARLSPASDRMVLSICKHKGEGSLLLRNADLKFSCNLSLPGRWIPVNSSSDVEFAQDGTIVIGASKATRTCRVWNAGNGEVLRDLSLHFSSPVEVVGMITNTHVLFRDDCLRVADVASGELVALLPLDGALVHRTSHVGLKISPKGNFIIGGNNIGQIKIFQCHNFAAIKRKTTLQRIKSLTKF